MAASPDKMASVMAAIVDRAFELQTIWTTRELGNPSVMPPERMNSPVHERIERLHLHVLKVSEHLMRGGWNCWAHTLADVIDHCVHGG
jgi:hypothetical protein